MSTALATTEAARLVELETTIERGLQTFVDVGSALAEIRDSGLYRDGHGTFEDYCRERWHIERRRAYQLIEAAAVVQNVNHGSQIQPASERVARPLTSLAPEQQREAWREAVETAPRNEAGEPKITAAHVESVVSRVAAAPAAPETNGNGNRLAVHHSSETQEWYTPPEVIAAVVAALGAIDLDPCSNPGEPVIPASSHFTYMDDGLTREWRGRVYMNPPYGRGIGEWTDKLRDAYESGSVTEAIALLPARTDTAWMYGLRNYARCFVRGRISFSGHENAAPFPSCAVYLGPDAEKFARAFAELGDTFVLLDEVA